VDHRTFQRRVASNIKKARWAAGLTQAEAASDQGLDFRHYQELEQGRVDPKLSTLRSVAVGLGTTVAALVEIDANATRRARERMAVAKPLPSGRKPKRGRRGVTRSRRQ